MALSTAPAAPQRSSPSTFAALADAFVAWMENLPTEFNNDLHEELTETVTSTSNAVTCDLDNANIFQHTTTEATTFTFSNGPAAGKARGFSVEITHGGTAYTITWPTHSTPDGVALPSVGANETGLYSFLYIGTTLYGFFTAGDLS